MKCVSSLCLLQHIDYCLNYCVITSVYKNLHYKHIKAKIIIQSIQNSAFIKKKSLCDQTFSQADTEKAFCTRQKMILIFFFTISPCKNQALWLNLSVFPILPVCQEWRHYIHTKMPSPHSSPSPAGKTSKKPMFP